MVIFYLDLKIKSTIWKIKGPEVFAIFLLFCRKNEEAVNER